MALLMASCTTNIPSYREVAVETPHVVITNQGTAGIDTTACQMPFANRLCGASLLLVDGQKVAFTSSKHRIGPGTRRLRLMCSFWQGGPFVLGTMASVAKDLEVTLEAEQSYQVAAGMVGDTCDVSLVDAVTNQTVGSEKPFGHAGSDDEIRRRSSE